MFLYASLSSHTGARKDQNDTYNRWRILGPKGKGYDGQAWVKRCGSIFV